MKHTAASYRNKNSCRCEICTEAHRAYKKVQRDKMKELTDTLKDVPCADCNTTYPPYVMQFDHRPDEDKRDNVAALRKRNGEATIRAEAAKCDVVCANCHAVRTEQRRLNVLHP